MYIIRAKFLSNIKLVQIVPQTCYNNKVVFTQCLPKSTKAGKKLQEKISSYNQELFNNVCRQKGPCVNSMWFDNPPDGAPVTALFTERVQLNRGKPGKKAGKIGGEYRSFSKSSTYKNVTLPLRTSRLANPFPDPVKTMPSQTVSDKEKADRMFQDSRKAARSKK